MIYILIGKSASGKDRALNRIIDGKPVKGIDIKDRCLPIITCTTRPMRVGEVNGKDYHFITKELFKRMASSGEMLEWRCYHTLVQGKADDWYYGTPWTSVQNFESQDYIAIVDCEGAKAYIDACGKENCKVFYIYASDEVRKERAMKRGSFDETEWNRRLRDDEEKFGEEALSEIRKELGENFVWVDNNTNSDNVTNLSLIHI